MQSLASLQTDAQYFRSMLRFVTLFYASFCTDFWSLATD
jgi:hypothetical protein